MRQSSIKETQFSDSYTIDDMLLSRRYSPSAMRAVQPEHPQAAQYMQALESLKYYMQDDWNGYGAKAIQKITISTVRNFLKRIPNNFSYPDKIIPDVDGYIMLKWERDDKLCLVTADGMNLHFAYKDNRTNERILYDDLPYTASETRIPSIIMQSIKKFPL